MGLKQKAQSKLATHWGAFYDTEKGKDVWPHYAVKNAVRETFIGLFIFINLLTYFLIGGEGLNTGFLPTGLSTTRAIILIVIMLTLYPSTVNLMGEAMDKLPMVEYREDMEEETDEDNAVLGYLDKKYGGEEK